MSNQFLKLRRSAVPGRVPSTSSIDFGEIALNTFDGLAFIKRSGSNGEEVITLGSREGAFTGSFSGSFVGNGGGLFNISASAIVGLNLSQIATGSVSASVGVGASSFSVVSGSNTFLYVSSSGNVGIGTSTPSTTLDVAGNIRGGTFIVGTTQAPTIYSSNGSLYHTINSTSYNYIWLRGSEIMRLTGGGNLLLGTTSDSGERLQVSGSSRFIGNMVITGSGNTSGTNALSAVNSSNGSLLTVRNDGNVGIGTSTPDYNLHLRKDGSNVDIYLQNDASNIARIATGTNWIIGPLGEMTTISGLIGNAYGIFRSGTTVGIASYTTLVLITANVIRARLFNTGNFVIGSSIDNGARLQVAGSSTFASDMTISGSGNTSATNALTVVNSSNSSLLIVRNDGNVTVPGTANILTSLMVGTNPLSSGVRLETDGVFRAWTRLELGQFGSLSMDAAGVSKSTTGASFFEFANQSGHNAVAGTYYFLQLRNSVNPTSGNAIVNGLNLNFTINQTGGANGITRGLYVNPTLTSAANWRSIEWSNNASGSAIWGLYGSGSAPNYLSGSLNIGTTTLGANILNVNGSTAINGNTTITGSLTVSDTITAQTLVVQTITSSTDYVSGSTIFGNSLSNTHQFTGSVSITGSLSVNGGSVPLGSGAAGQVTYWTGPSAVSGSNNLFWNAANNRLGINTATPSAALQVVGTVRATNIGSPLLFSEGSDDLTLATQGGTPALTIKATTRNTQLYNGSQPADNGARLQVSGNVTVSGNMRIDGNIGLGTSATSDTNMYITKTLSGSVYPSGFYFVGTVASTSTTGATIFTSDITTQAASFTLPRLEYFKARQTTFGAGSTVTNQYGFFAESTLNGATNNYGFWGDIQSGTGRWNLYMNGSANNYMAGNLLLGVTSDNTARLQVSGSSTFAGNMVITGSSNTSGTNALTIVNSANANALIVKNNRTTSIISDAGQMYVSSNADATNGVFELDANSSATQAIFIQLTRGTLGFATTAINQTAVRINGGFAPTSGTATWHSLHVNPIINQTGGANGITRGLYIQPILTSPSDWRSIEWSNNISGSTSWGLYGAGSAPNFLSGSLGLGTTSPTARLDVRGNTYISGALDILDAELNYQRNNNVTTGSARLIASIPTGSYNAAFFDYTIVSGSNARAGTVTSVWVSSSVEWNETYTNDIGSTTDVSLYAAITGSSIGLFATSSINNTWTIKSLIRTI